MSTLSTTISGVTGLEEVIANIGAHRERLAKGCERGVKQAALLLQRESQKVVPVEFGPLKASAFTKVTGAGFNTVAQVGYSAPYALYVHEAVGMKLKGLPRRPSPPHRGRYWDPQGRAQAKFLEGPARALVPQLRALIQQAMKI